MKKIIRLIAALVLLCAANLKAQTAGNASVDDLQTQMYQLFYQEDSLEFYKTIDLLKEACLAAGNEQVFYKAWGNHAIYESTHQRRNHALEIAKEMGAYAKEHESTFGTYTSKHVMGSIYQQMRDYDNAEQSFLDAAEFLHNHAPGESAAADYIELTLVAVNGRSDLEQGYKYAEMALQEPNVSDQHRLRSLSLLCQMEGDKLHPNRERFNKYYQMRQAVREHTPADSPEKSIKELYFFINGNYDEALSLTNELKPDVGTYERARIYHALGNDAEAFHQMLIFKSVRDSLNRAERFGLLSDYIKQLNNERLELEKKTLEKENQQLRFFFVLTIVLFITLIIAYFGWKRYKLSKVLHKKNVELDKENQEERKARRDEHEARMAEQEARIKVEKELDIKREFLNNVAQELRSPLNPITGFSDILADSDMQLNPEERAMMNDHIKANTKQLTSIIDNMIELSLYESKSSLPKDDTFNPNIIAQNAIDYARQFQKEGVEMGLITQVADNVQIKSDLTAVGKVLRHLLRNAGQHTEKGGITLLCTDEGDMIRFTVTDTGRGIEPEQVNRIFHPLTQSGSNVKSTGMGLAICSRITQLLNGKLELDTTYKKGSRFIFEIPKE